MVNTQESEVMIESDGEEKEEWIVFTSPRKKGSRNSYPVVPVRKRTRVKPATATAVPTVKGSATSGTLHAATNSFSVLDDMIDSDLNEMARDCDIFFGGRTR